MPPSTSTPCRLDAITWRGFDALMLDNGQVRAVVVPALGGKIASLVHLRSGREWMWKHPTLKPAAPAFGASYVEAHDLGGFDECFPSVASTRHPDGPWEGTPIPDHGEVWALPWEAETFCDGQTIEVRLRAHGVRFPYRFERSIFMTGGEAALKLIYAATNFAPMPFPFLWSAHPVFQVNPGMKLIAPVKDMTVYSSVGDRFGTLGAKQAWPELVETDGRRWDMSKLPETDAGIALKLYGQAPSLGYVALQDLVLGAELRMHFDPTEVTHLGLWLNFGGWAGAPGAQPYYNLAIEPCIGAQDDLAIAHRHYRDAGVLPPCGRRTWQLDITMR